MEIIQSVIGFFIAIGILVTFHEFGHFYIARLFNVKVINFSIGFGQTIFKKKFNKDGTEYSIGLIPLGGYVKMLESSELENTTNNKLIENCFDKQSVYKRFLIVAAGPIFNLILAVVFFTFVHFAGINGMKPYVESIDNINLQFSKNQKYEIIQVNNTKTQRWQDVRVEILNTVVNQESLDIHIRDDKNEILITKINYNSDLLKEEGDIISNIGINPKQPDFSTTIGHVENNSPASLAGLKVGDEILSINDENISYWSDLVDRIQQNPNNILQLDVKRNQDIVDIILVPSTKNSQNQDAGYAGISPDRDALSDYNVLVKYPFFQAIHKSINLTYDYSVLTFQMIFELFTGQANVKNISGPLSIAEFSGKTLSMGFVYFSYLLAILSISLGVLNLLPIPVLDGGHLVYYLIEMVVGKPVPEKIQLVAQQFGLVILLGIMVLAFYNDFARILQ